MSRTSGVMLLMPALLAVAAFTAITERTAQPVACEIRANRTPVGMEIDGVVRGHPGQSGSYQFELEKTGASGNSDVSQGGDFTIPSTGTTTVSASELNLSRGDVYRVAMTLSTGARCNERLPGR